MFKIKNLTALLLGLCFSFVIGEICCRYFLPISTVCYFYDKEIGTTLAPDRSMRWTNRLDYDNAVITNSAGFHDTEHAIEKAKNTYRVLVLGDSFIEALQLPIYNGFCKQLEEMLESKVKDKNIEVINLGLSGRGPAQYYRVLQKIGLQYHPDLVVMAILPENDFTDSYKSFSNYSYKPYYRLSSKGNVEMIPFSVPPWYSVKSLLTHSSMAYFFAYEILKRPAVANIFIRIGFLPSIDIKKDAIKKTGPAALPLSLGLFLEEPDEEWQKAYAITLRMVREARDLAKGNGSDFIAFAIPGTMVVEGKTEAVSKQYKGYSLDFNKPFNELARYCEEWGIPFVDLTPSFIEDYKKNKISHSWAHDGHWNLRGHKLGAKVVGDSVAGRITGKK